MNRNIRIKGFSLLRRFATFLKYSAVSLSSSLIDMGMFQIFVLLLRARVPGRYIVLSTVFARIISSVYNFLMNYLVVFGRGGSGKAVRGTPGPDLSAPDTDKTDTRSETVSGSGDRGESVSAAPGSAGVSPGAAAVRYFTLVIVQMLCSAFLVNSFYRLTRLPELVVKIIVDSCLFLISYQIQKHLVFRGRH